MKYQFLKVTRYAGKEWQMSEKARSACDRNIDDWKNSLWDGFKYGNMPLLCAISKKRERREEAAKQYPGYSSCVTLRKLDSIFVKGT